MAFKLFRMNWQTDFEKYWLTLKRNIHETNTNFQELLRKQSGYKTNMLIFAKRGNHSRAGSSVEIRWIEIATENHKDNGVLHNNRR